MPRSKEYQQFLDVINDKKKIDVDPDEETVATPEEIGWWKRFQTTRALHHARYDTSTGVEIHLLDSHNIPVSQRARARTRQRERE